MASPAISGTQYAILNGTIQALSLIHISLKEDVAYDVLKKTVEDQDYKVID